MSSDLCTIVNENFLKGILMTSGLWNSRKQFHPFMPGAARSSGSSSYWQILITF